MKRIFCGIFVAATLSGCAVVLEHLTADTAMDVLAAICKLCAKVLPDDPADNNQQEVPHE